ncbi:Brp/Blh family beta-carotene 15,15'-dioxygenase [Sandarakinorhabdus sp.]|uniref:Brp/Blh family beta-carotene 15,15'-dioxygenase n=1 Tax=Sandarakinorhabdus sp. TaxID=1916663 RepID=UPI00286DA19F|nr:Brp/Blh family beta-carotene 15,15'-dioxygenase [Sandarakinorhabdus sp.]
MSAISANYARATHFPAGGVLLVTALSIGLNMAGLIDQTPMMTAILASSLLVFGLPHGSLDLALLRRAGATGSTVCLILLYVGCAAAMYLVWRLAPVLALAVFLVMAVAHFAEDWEACGSRFIATAVAAATVTAPALLHLASLRALFTLLTGDRAAAVLADLSLLVAPVALAVALVGVGLLWQSDRKKLAVLASCGLAAMLLLPPMLGFAIFFCLVHSPLQFRTQTEALGLKGARQWRGVVVPISLGGLGMAGVIFLLHDGPSLTNSVFAVSFMTLSLLTVPHMMVPIFANQFSNRQRLGNT